MNYSQYHADSSQVYAIRSTDAVALFSGLLPVETPTPRLPQITHTRKYLLSDATSGRELRVVADLPLTYFPGQSVTYKGGSFIITRILQQESRVTERP